MRRTRFLVLFGVMLVLAPVPSALAGIKATMSGSPPAAAIPATSCALPKALDYAGETVEARKAYVKVLESDPSASCAREGLKKLNEPAPKSASQDCERGQTYQALHRGEGAQKAFEKALEADPKAPCAKKGLEEIGPSDLTRAVNWIVDAIIDVAIGLGIVLLAGFLLLMIGWVPLLNRPIRHLPGLGRLIGPRLSIGAFEDEASGMKPGAALTAATKESVRELREETTADDLTAYDLDWPAPQEEFADFVAEDGVLKNALEKASDISDQAKIVAALLSLAYAILPIKRLSLSGAVAPTHDGVSVALGLENSGRLEAAVTLTSILGEGEDPAVADYVQLAKPAAVWTQFGVGSILSRTPIAPDDAESFGLLRLGLDALAPPQDKVAARTYFREAVRLNRRNWAAYVGLASIPDDDEVAYETVIDALLLGLDELARESDNA